MKTPEEVKTEIINAVTFERMTRNALRPRFQRCFALFDQVYAELLESGQIYETGRGVKGSPAFPHIGPAPGPVKPATPTRKYQVIIDQIQDETIFEFIMAVSLAPEEWNLNINEELNKHIRAYHPARPY